MSEIEMEGNHEPRDITVTFPWGDSVDINTGNPKNVHDLISSLEMPPPPSRNPDHSSKQIPISYDYPLYKLCKDPDNEDNYTIIPVNVDDPEYEDDMEAGVVIDARGFRADLTLWLADHMDLLNDQRYDISNYPDNYTEKERVNFQSDLVNARTIGKSKLELLAHGFRQLLFQADIAQDTL